VGNNDLAASLPFIRRRISMRNQRCVFIAASVFGFLCLSAGVSNADDTQFELTGFDKTDIDGLAAGQRTGILAVRWNRIRVSDAALKVLKRWPDLYGVYLSESSVTGAGLQHLQDQKELRQVALLGPIVNDEGLAALKYVKGVTHLQISNG
jgi:hypothetical protein